MASHSVLVDLDMEGNRVRDAAASALGTDYVIRDELESGSVFAPINEYVDATVGDGAATDYVINHALSNANATTTVMLNSSKEIVTTKVVNTDANNVTVTFNVAPALNAYTVIVHG